MWTLPPEDSLWIVNQRRSGLIREAAEYRLARSRPDETRGQPARRLIKSVRIRIASLASLVRRTLAYHDAPCNEPCPDVAFR
jgi:hypothetical protein